jgi:tetratricopeptide (TPR) repeat protein
VVVSIFSSRDREKTQNPSLNQGNIRYIILIFLLAIVIRGLYLIDSSDNLTFNVPVVDSRTYDQIAREVVDKGNLTRDLFWQPPFYPLFLSLIYLFSKGSILSVKVFQMILGGLTCVLVYLLGRKIFNKRIGLLAGIIAALYLPLIFFEGELLATGWAAFWSVVLVLVFLSTAEKPGVVNCFFLGLSGALSIITRPVFLPFFIACCIWLIMQASRQKTLKRLLPMSILITAGFLAVSLPVGLLGYHTTGKIRILPFSGGINFYIGNNPDYKKTITLRPGLGWEKFIGLPQKYGINSIYEKEKFYRNEAISYAVNEPLNFSKGLLSKTTQFFTSREIPRNVNIYSFRKWSKLLRIGVWEAKGFGFPFGLLLSLAVVGTVYWWRKIPGPLWLLMVLYPASVILIFVASRYRIPVVPSMCVLASGGCAALYQVVKKQEWVKIVSLSAVFLLVITASSSFGPFHQEKLNYDAELNYFLGIALEERGQTDRAKEAYREAIRLKPDYADVYYNLGVIMAEQGGSAEAMKYYRRAIEIDPDYSAAYYNLGALLQSQGKLDEAIWNYYQTLRVQPYDAYAHNNLGNALRREGKLVEAIRHYRLALQFKPDYDLAHNNLGYALFRQGDMDKASQHFQKALDLRPFWPPALTGLARILATHPDRDKRNPEKAVFLAAKAAELTKYKDARVLNILAMAYAATGQFPQAESTAKKALELSLDAQNFGLASEIRKRIELYKNGKTE